MLFKLQTMAKRAILVSNGQMHNYILWLRETTEGWGEFAQERRNEGPKLNSENSNYFGCSLMLSRTIVLSK